MACFRRGTKANKIQHETHQRFLLIERIKSTNILRNEIYEFSQEIITVRNNLENICALPLDFSASGKISDATIVLIINQTRKNWPEKINIANISDALAIASDGILLMFNKLSNLVHNSTQKFLIKTAIFGTANSASADQVMIARIDLQDLIGDQPNSIFFKIDREGSAILEKLNQANMIDRKAYQKLMCDYIDPN